MDLIDAIMAGRNAVEEEAVVFGVDPAPPAPPETYTPCMLPDEEEEIKREEEEDDIAGINDDGYTCEMCRIGDSQITGDTPLLLEAVYNLYPAMSESYPEDMIFDFQAKRWNSTLYRVDKALNHRLRIKKISKAEVRHHMRNDVPKNQSKRRIERRLQFLDRSLTQIEQNGYWEKVTRGGAAGKKRSKSRVLSILFFTC